MSLESIRRTMQPKRDLAVNTKDFFLLGPYEGKATKWSEEIARAKVESRFPEKMRDSYTWSLRAISPDETTLGIVSAIVETDKRSEEGMIAVVGCSANCEEVGTNRTM